MAVALGTSVVSGADPATGARDKAATLRREGTELRQRAQRAVLDLYAIETQLSRAQTRLAVLQAQTARVRDRRAVARRELGIARRVLAVSQQRLGERLRTLYEQGDVDPLAVLLASASLDEALTNITALRRANEQGEHVIRQTRSTRTKLRRLSSELDARSRRLSALERDAAQAASSLAASRAERRSLIATLRMREHLDARAIALLEVTAHSAGQKSAQLTAARLGSTPAGGSTAQAPPVATSPADAASARASAPAPAPSGVRTLTVLATGYSIHGHTATGVPTGWGVAAVDPALIPLGTRFDVPGYGVAVAADTGGAVRGALIDLWFPTLAQARAWGRRTVTITLH